MSVTKHVDLSVYRANLKLTIDTMKPARVMAVIKDDGYGHGLIETAKAAAEAGVEILGVLDIETGMAIRQAGLKIATFAWLFSPESDFGLAARAGIELSAGSLSELEAIGSAGSRPRVHLKLDSGLSRNGCRPELWTAFVTRAMELDRQGAISVVAIWSHLSGTSEKVDRESLEIFEAASKEARELGFVGYRHVASSPSAFGLPASRYDLVRIGVSAFGTSPAGNVTAKTIGLGSPMSVTAEVISEGLISIGFLHGYFSDLSQRSSVRIGGNSYRVLKVGPLASAVETGNYSPGDIVGIFGQDNSPTAEELCDLVGTVTDELFTGLKTNSTVYSQ